MIAGADTPMAAVRRDVAARRPPPGGNRSAMRGLSAAEKKGRSTPDARGGSAPSVPGRDHAGRRLPPAGCPACIRAGGVVLASPGRGAGAVCGPVAPLAPVDAVFRGHLPTTGPEPRVNTAPERP